MKAFPLPPSLLSGILLSTILALPVAAIPETELDWQIPPEEQPWQTMEEITTDTISPPIPDTETSLDQITSVNQLADVKPTDWAYQALQELVETYGCVVGFPDSTYRGNRALSRYEFAAGLNACLEKIVTLINQGETDLVSQADLVTLQRLQDDFDQELAELDSRVGNLEDRIAALEANQFSTTTKLRGAVTFALTDVLAGNGDSQTTFQGDGILRFSTSFTGQDLLAFGMRARSTPVPSFDTPNNGVDVGTTDEGSTVWAFGGASGYNVRLTNLDYTFPVFRNGDSRMVVSVFTSRGFASGANLLGTQSLDWTGPGRPTSAFAFRSPIFRINGRSGILARYQINKYVRIGGTYQANPGNDPENGLFNGNYFAAAQMILTPSDNLSVALTYANTYSLPGQFRFNRNRNNPNARAFLGTALANRFDNAGVFFPDDVAVVANAYSLKAYYQINPKINIGGFVMKTSARLLGEGDADIWSWAGILTFTDLFKEGNVGGIIVGMEPTLTGLRKGDDFVGGFERDTSLHIEAYYYHRINRNLAISPGIIWITAPNQDASNPDIVVGAFRTVLSF